VSGRTREKIVPCAGCGRSPRGTVRVGQGFCHYRLECRTCGRATADGQGFEQAVKEWNEGAKKSGAATRPA